MITDYNYDKWRENYNNMTFKEQKEFYNEFYETHLDQGWKSHLDDLIKAFQQIKGYSNVIELGCNDGTLAQAMIKRFPILKWHGYDISRTALMKTKVDTPVYQFSELNSQFWECVDVTGYDVFIASHVLEHLSFKQVKLLLNHITPIKYWIIAMPELKSNWKGYLGTHVLEVRWKEITAYAKLLKRKEYVINNGTRVFFS